MKIKNLLSLILAMLVIFGIMLVSCNDPSDSDTDTNTEVDTETDTDAGVEDVDLEGYKISLTEDKKQEIKIQNHSGEPIANAVVRFKRANGDESMDMTDSTGVISKTLKAGNTFITVENSVTKKTYYLVLKEATDG